MPVNDTNSSQNNPLDSQDVPPIARADMDRIQQMSDWQKKFSVSGDGVKVSVQNSANACSIHIQGEASVTKKAGVLPPAHQRYVVLTTIDDSYKWVITYPRFSS